MKVTSFFTFVFFSLVAISCQKEDSNVLQGDKALLSGKTIVTNCVRIVETPYNQSNFMIQNVNFNKSRVEYEAHVFNVQPGGTLVDIDGVQFYSIYDSYGKLIAFQNNKQLISAGLRIYPNKSFEIYFLEGDFPTTVISFAHETF